MLIAEKISRANLEHEAQERYRAMFPEAARPPRLANAGAVLDLAAGKEFEFRGRTYVSRPVAYLDGIRIQELLERLRTVREHDDNAAAREELIGFFEDAIDLCGALLRPTGFHGLLWRIGYRRNAFVEASEADLTSLLAGFWRCRTTVSVRPADRHRRRKRI